MNINLCESDTPKTLTRRQFSWFVTGADEKKSIPPLVGFRSPFINTTKFTKAASNMAKRILNLNIVVYHLLERP